MAYPHDGVIWKVRRETPESRARKRSLLEFAPLLLVAKNSEKEVHARCKHVYPSPQTYSYRPGEDRTGQESFVVLKLRKLKRKKMTQKDKEQKNVSRIRLLRVGFFHQPESGSWICRPRIVIFVNLLASLLKKTKSQYTGIYIYVYLIAQFSRSPEPFFRGYVG